MHLNFWLTMCFARNFRFGKSVEFEKVSRDGKTARYLSMGDESCAAAARTDRIRQQLSKFAFDAGRGRFKRG